jgi:hypothetical protein
MKEFFKKNKSFLGLGILLWQFFITPLKSFALDYTPLEGDAFKMFGGENTDGNLTKFLQQAFQFGLAIAAALAVVMIVYGGVEIMLSESVFKKEDGRKKIKEAIYGLLLALVSWLILYIINPEILNFKI